MPRITPLKVALGVGVAGALVDVSSSIRFVEGLTFSEGQTSQFTDTAAGTVQFVIENYAGWYTPNNPSSPLQTLMSEGTVVSTQVGSLLRQFSVVSFGFPTSVTDDGLLTLFCDDMLGDASRNNMVSLSQSMVAAIGGFLWLLDDDASASAAVEVGGGLQLSVTEPPATFGAAGAPLGDSGQLTLASPSAATQVAVGGSLSVTIPQAPGVVYALGCWVTSSYASNEVWEIDAHPGFYLEWDSSSLSGNGVLISPLPAAGVPTYLSVVRTYTGSGPWTYTDSVYVNGTLNNAITGSPSGTAPSSFVSDVRISYSSALTTTSASFSHMSITSDRIPEELAAITTEAGRLQAIDLTTPEITLGTLPTDLSPAPVGVDKSSGSSVLDALNVVIRTEQGYIYTATSGTLLAPTQVIKVRARNRPAAVVWTFDAITEVGQYIPFLRDITQLASSTTAAGPDNSVTYVDSSLIGRVGSKNISETVLSENSFDLFLWATDRSYRAKNPQLTVTSITIDALTTPTDRSADLLAMIRGDRVRFQNIPSTSLGLTFWDGWLIGKTESHTLTSHTFTLSLAACLPAEAVFDTSRFAADGALYLSAAITSTATSMSVATLRAAVGNIPATLLSTTEAPYNLQIDSEVVTVTAVSGATPQVATVVRAQAGTVAASHSSGALLEIATLPLFAY